MNLYQKFRDSALGKIVLLVLLIYGVVQWCTIGNKLIWVGMLSSPTVESTIFLPLLVILTIICALVELVAAGVIIVELGDEIL